MRQMLASMIVVLGLATGANAGPLEPGHVAKDAKWLLHMDFDVFHKTRLAGQLREKKLNDPNIQKRLEWVRDSYGIDLRKDLHGLTIYGDSYDRHEGVALLEADFDRQKTLDVVKSAPGYSTSTHRDYTLHTWTVHHNSHDKSDGKRSEGKAEDKRKKAKKGEAKEVEKADKAGPKHKLTITAALRKKVVVLASDPEKIKRALDVLDNEKPRLGKESPLLGERPDGTFFYGAAVDLKGLKNRKGMLDFAVLQQGERITVASGEKEDQAFKQVRFLAQSEEVAGRIQKVLEGFQAMLQLQGESKPLLAKIADGMKWNVEGRAVTVDWKADASTVMEVFKHMKEKAERMERWEERLEDKWEEDEDGEKKYQCDRNEKGGTKEKHKKLTET